MAIEVFNRVEKKFLLEQDTFEKILPAIEEYTSTDPYNINGEYYTLCSLYYDTPDNRFIRHSLSHPVYKEKLRLRSYGVPKEDDKVYLELKKKFRGTVNKRRTALYYPEALSFLETGILPELKSYMNPQVLQELYAFRQANPLIRPSCLVAYDRLAFFSKEDRFLRISFDKNIRTRHEDLSLLSGDYGEALLPDSLRLMEIKACGSYPLWLVKILSGLELRRHRFSKYGTSYLRQKQQLLNTVTEEQFV